jgi:hypothetical protein
MSHGLRCPPGGARQQVHDNLATPKLILENRGALGRCTPTALLVASPPRAPNLGRRSNPQQAGSVRGCRASKARTACPALPASTTDARVSRNGSATAGWYRVCVAQGSAPTRRTASHIRVCSHAFRSHRRYPDTCHSTNAGPRPEPGVRPARRHRRGSPTTSVRTRSEMNGGWVAAGPAPDGHGRSAARSYRAWAQAGCR